MTEELDSLDKVRTEEQAAHVTRTSVELQRQQVDALCRMSRFIRQEHVHLMVVVWSSFESPWTNRKRLQPPQVADEQLCLREHERERERIDVEEGEQLDAQVLLARVVHGGEADHASVDLLLVDHVDLGVAPHADSETLVIVLDDAPGVHSFQVTLLEKLELVWRVGIVQGDFGVLGLASQTLD